MRIDREKKEENRHRNISHVSHYLKLPEIILYPPTYCVLGTNKEDTNPAK